MSMPTDLQAVDDAVLRDRIAYLRALTEPPEDDGLGDDNLTGPGWVELLALEAERDRRAEAAEAVRCGLCGRQKPLAPDRSICADCAYWPLD